MADPYLIFCWLPERAKPRLWRCFSRSHFMSSKRFFDHRLISLFIILLISAGVQTTISQDSAKTWEDSSTGLMWTVEDNSGDLNWNQANAYCEDLTLEGHTDWRLATLEELEGLYDRNLKKQYKAKGPVNLQSASVWSGSKNSLGDSWMFNFGYGGSSLSSGGGGCGTLGRAICTRKSGSK